MGRCFSVFPDLSLRCPRYRNIFPQTPQTTWDTFCPEVAHSRASPRDSNQQPQKAMEQLPVLTSASLGGCQAKTFRQYSLVAPQGVFKKTHADRECLGSGLVTTQHVQRGPLQPSCHCIKDRWLSLHWSTSGQISE